MKTHETGTRRATDRPTAGSRDLPARKALWPAIVASGACSVLAAPASALQLGNVDVHSSLGQPLRASIAFALSPNEQLQDYCIFLQPPAAGLPGVRDAVIGVANGRIVIRGTTPLKEPIVSMGVAVSCPYTVNIVRSYTLMLDPATETTSAQTQSVSTPAVTRAEPAPAIRTTRPQPSAIAPAPTRTAAAAPSSRSEEPIDAGSYRVRPGDTLSDIVARIENRSLGLWAAVGVVFDANPDAFIDGDMNRLKAGSLLTIPSLDGETTARLAAPAVATEPAPRSIEAPPVNDTAAGAVDMPAEAADAETVTTAAIEESPVENTAADPVEASTTTFDQTIDLQPGEPVDVSPDAGVDPVDAAEVAAGNETAQDPGATVAEPSSAVGGTTPSWLFWTLGALGLLGVALALFGWRNRRQTPPDAAAAEAHDTDADTQTVRDQALAFDMDDATSVEAEQGLDLDFDSGAGFRSVGDVEVAQDFGFSTTRDLGVDLEMVLPANQTGSGNGKSATDVLPVLPTDEHTILEREILPSDDDEDGDYDVSMIVDATRQRFNADRDVTTKDLNVVAIEGDENEDTGEYTLSDEVDYQILEQDYEDELTATQVLNTEIQKAAQDLQARIEAGTEDATSTNQVTSLLDRVEDETGVNETLDETMELTTEETVEMPADEGEETLETRMIEGRDGDDLEEFVDDRTAEIPGAQVESRKAEDTQASTERLPADLPIAGNDDTAEIEVETGHFKTRKSAG